MTVVISALAFVVLLSFLVLIHECGHFTAARLFGVKVEEFGFGLPPRIMTLFKCAGTKFTLNWIPFGGFVRLQGEGALSEAQRRKKGSFATASIPGRIIILTAGVFMNLIFALFVFTLGFSLWHWVPTYLTPQDMKDAASRGQITLTPGIRIASVDPQGAGARAGVPPQSILLSVENEPVYFPQDVRDLQKGRDLVHYRLRLVSGVVQDVGVSVRDGKTGVTLEMLPTVLAGKNHRLTYAFGLALREAGVTMIQTVSGITHLFTSLLSTASVPEGITGIVGIAQITHVSVQEGFIAYLRLMAVLSLSLAALNILPLPALDGGRLIFVLLEAVRRRPAPRRLELVTNSVGFLLLIALIILVTFNDIRHLL